MIGISPVVKKSTHKINLTSFSYELLKYSFTMKHKRLALLSMIRESTQTIHLMSFSHELIKYGFTVKWLLVLKGNIRNYQINLKNKCSKMIVTNSALT